MKALTPAQRETRKSALGIFLNTACAFFVVFATGMDSLMDWLALAWCVTCLIGCTYYVQSDIRKALKEEGTDGTS